MDAIDLYFIDRRARISKHEAGGWALVHRAPRTANREPRREVDAKWLKR
jgi:hypothetical protein